MIYGNGWLTSYNKYLTMITIIIIVIIIKHNIEKMMLKIKICKLKLDLKKQLIPKIVNQIILIIVNILLRG
jgi:hypothetical protein